MEDTINGACGFAFLPLTSDDPEPPLDDSNGDGTLDGTDENITPKTTTPYWVDDSICQENLMDIMTLTPDVTTTDNGNHICANVHLFFEEIGYLTEEPQPIDPSKDYWTEYQEQLKLQKKYYKKSRRHHIELSRMPSLLDDNDATASGVSSSSSSFIQHQHQDNDYNHGHHNHQNHHMENQHHHHHHHHHHMDSHHPSHQQHHPSDVRSPYFLGVNQQYDLHQHQAYTYGSATASGLDKYHRHRHQPLH